MTDDRIHTPSENGPTFVRITQDDPDGPGAVTVDGQPVEVPAGGDPATLALAVIAEQARREAGDVRAVVVDDRDGWKHHLVVHSDGEIDEDLARPARAPTPRRWHKILPAAAGVLLTGVLLVAGAWTATRSRPAAGPTPAGSTLLGAAPLHVPSPSSAATENLLPPTPPPSSSVGSTTSLVTSSRATTREQSSRPARPTTARRSASTSTRPPSTRPSDPGSRRRGQSDSVAPTATSTAFNPGSARRGQSESVAPTAASTPFNPGSARRPRSGG